MGKKAKDAMQYEDIPELNTSKRIKQNKKEYIKMKTTQVKVTNINDMKTWAIVWHLIKRHKLSISVTLNVVLILVNSTGGKQLLHLIWR